MNVSPDVNFEELARSTDDFNAAQLKAVCVEAGMLALRRDATEVRSRLLWPCHLRVVIRLSAEPSQGASTPIAHCMVKTPSMPLLFRGQLLLKPVLDCSQLQADSLTLVHAPACAGQS